MQKGRTKKLGPKWQRRLHFSQGSSVPPFCGGLHGGSLSLVSLGSMRRLPRVSLGGACRRHICPFFFGSYSHDSKSNGRTTMPQPTGDYHGSLSLSRFLLGAPGARTSVLEVASFLAASTCNLKLSDSAKSFVSLRNSSFSHTTSTRR